MSGTFPDLSIVVLTFLIQLVDSVEELISDKCSGLLCVIKDVRDNNCQLVMRSSDRLRDLGNLPIIFYKKFG